MEEQAFEVVRCSQCGAKNRLPRERPHQNPKCGKCHAPFKTEPSGEDRATSYVLRCIHCRTKNRVRSTRLHDPATCGRCSKPLDVRAIFTPQPINISDSDFEHQVLKSPIPVLLFAWAPWCSTCTVVAPVIDRFAGEVLGKVRVCKVNVGSHPALGNTLNVMSVPHLFIYDNGRQLESLPGTLDRNQLMIKMASYVY
jgi:thioredoxin 2